MVKFSEWGDPGLPLVPAITLRSTLLGPPSHLSHTNQSLLPVGSHHSCPHPHASLRVADSLSPAAAFHLLLRDRSCVSCFEGPPWGQGYLRPTCECRLERERCFIFSEDGSGCTGGWPVSHSSLLTFHCPPSPVAVDNLEVPSWLFHSLPGGR